MIRETLTVGDAEDFAGSVRMTLALLEDLRSHVAAAHADSEAAAEQFAVVLLGSTNTSAETAGTAAALAAQRIEDALLLVDSSADYLTAYAADVLGPRHAAGSGDTGGTATPGSTPIASRSGGGDRDTATTPARDVDDGESLRGATKKEVADAARRAGWTLRGRSRDGNGDVWVHPTKRGEQIIINDGYSWSDDPMHRGPYVKISRNGDRSRYPLHRSED
jgi:hypothetical protein